MQSGKKALLLNAFSEHVFQNCHVTLWIWRLEEEATMNGGHSYRLY